MVEVVGTGKRADKRRIRRTEFIQHAAETFVELGLRDTTMEDVAARIGVSKMVLYRYFESRDALVDAVLEQAKRQVLEVDQLPWAGYEEAARRVIKVGWSNPAGFLLLLRDSKTDPAFCHHYEELWQSVADRLAGNFVKVGLPEPYAQLSGAAMTDYVISGLIRWVQYGTPEQDESFVKWSAAGTDALDHQWRRVFAGSDENLQLINAALGVPERG